MRIGVVWAATAVALLALKLFTYEFYLPDDPTGGIALRRAPAVVSKQHLQPGDSVLLSDENEFLGAGLYRAAVGWGYVAAVAAGPLLLIWRKRRAHRR